MRLVELDEVYRIDQQRREAAFAGNLGNDTAREREEQARAFDQQHRFHLALLGILDLEQAGIVEFADEQDGLFGGRFCGQFQGHFIEAIAVCMRRRADIDAEIDIGLGLDRAVAGILE